MRSISSSWLGNSMSKSNRPILTRAPIWPTTARSMRSRRRRRRTILSSKKRGGARSTQCRRAARSHRADLARQRLTCDMRDKHISEYLIGTPKLGELSRRRARFRSRISSAIACSSRRRGKRLGTRSRLGPDQGGVSAMGGAGAAAGAGGALLIVSVVQTRRSLWSLAKASSRAAT